MTPKEKAEELISNFLWTQRAFNELAKIKVAKECALIAVDEILKLEFIDSVFVSFSDLTLQEYYKEVKEEIEKL